MEDLPSIRQLRHCMIVDNTYPDIRVERQARALIERGHSVDVISVGGGEQPRREVMDGVHVHRVPLARQRGRGLLLQFREYVVFTALAGAALRRLNRRRYDVVQVHNVPDFLVFAALPARLTGARVLLDLHDLMAEFFASRFGGSMDAIPVRLVRWQERASHAFAHHVITVTEFWRQALIRRGLPEDKVDVVMNLPDEGLFALREPRVREQPDPLTLIYHGTLTRRYGIDLLVRAVARVKEQRPVHLILHGRGEMIPELADLITELGLDAEVELSTAWRPTNELGDVILRADIGVVPNRRDVFTDGILPTKLMEYAALGVPAIVARSTATEAHFDDEMVHYVEPDDVEALATAISQLGADATRRRALAERAQAFTAAHRWPDEARRYVAIVERLARPRADDNGRGAHRR